MKGAASFAIPIARWSAWPPLAASSAAPDVRFIEPQLRRRLGPLARMMLHVAQDCAADVPDLRLVFAPEYRIAQFGGAHHAFLDQCAATGPRW